MQSGHPTQAVRARNIFRQGTQHMPSGHATQAIRARNTRNTCSQGTQRRQSGHATHVVRARNTCSQWWQGHATYAVIARNSCSQSRQHMQSNNLRPLTKPSHQTTRTGATLQASSITEIPERDPGNQSSWIYTHFNEHLSCR